MTATDADPYEEWAVHRDTGVHHVVPDRYAGKTECGTFVNRLRIDESAWPLAERDLERNSDMCGRCRDAADDAKLAAGHAALMDG